MSFVSMSLRLVSLISADRRKKLIPIFILWLLLSWTAVLTSSNGVHDEIYDNGIHDNGVDDDDDDDNTSALPVQRDPVVVIGREKLDVVRDRSSSSSKKRTLDRRLAPAAVPSTVTYRAAVPVLIPKVDRLSFVNDFPPRVLRFYSGAAEADWPSPSAARPSPPRSSVRSPASGGEWSASRDLGGGGCRGESGDDDRGTFHYQAIVAGVSFICGLLLAILLCAAYFFVKKYLYNRLSLSSSLSSSSSSSSSSAHASNDSSRKDLLDEIKAEP